MLVLYAYNEFFSVLSPVCFHFCTVHKHAYIHVCYSNDFDSGKIRVSQYRLERIDCINLEASAMNFKCKIVYDDDDNYVNKFLSSNPKGSREVLRNTGPKNLLL
jgi:hypothetical protein